MLLTKSFIHFSDIEFGDLACFPINETYEAKTCKTFKNESTCLGQEGCEWDYAGSGLPYQILAGTAFITVFSVCNLFTGLTADRIAGKSRYFGRHTLFAIGVILFSVSLFLMGLSNAYWQLVILRMGIGKLKLHFIVT